MRSYFLVILAAMFLGGTGVAVKMAGSIVPPMSLAFYRVFFAFLFMLAVVPFLDRKTFKVKRKELRDYFIVGAVMAVSFSTYVMANIMTTVQNAVLLSYVHPFFVLFIAYFLLKERITKTKMVTLVMAIAGIAIISPFSATANVTGNIVAIASAGTHAFLIVLMRREDKDHSIGDVFWFFLFASVLLSPLPFIYGFGDLVPALPYVLILGLLATGLGYLLYNMSLEKLEAEMVTIIAMLVEPLVAVTLAVALIGETIGINVIGGGALLIAAGIYLETHKKKLKEKKK